MKRGLEMRLSQIKWYIRTGLFKAIHVLSGFLVGYAYPVRPFLASIAMGLFFGYESLQYYKSVDWPINETQEFATGFYLSLLFVILS